MCVCVIDLCIAVEVEQWDCFVDKLFAELPKRSNCETFVSKCGSKVL